jgi:hypothetical protein
MVAVITFLMCTPGLLFDTANFMRDMQYEAQHQAAGHGDVFLDTPSGYVMQIQNMMGGLTASVVLLGIAGLIYAAIRKHKWAWVLLSFFVPYYLLIGTSQVKFPRYGFPLYIGVAAGFAYGVSALQFRSKNQLVAAAIATVALVGVESPLEGIRGTAQYTAWMMGEDPRDACGRYFKDLAAQDPGLEVGITSKPEFFTPALFKDAVLLQFMSEDQLESYLAATRDPHVVPAHGSNPEYVVFTSVESADYERLDDSADLPQEDQARIHDNAAFYKGIRASYDLVKTFGDPRISAPDLQTIRPMIWVYKKPSI